MCPVWEEVLTAGEPQDTHGGRPPGQEVGVRAVRGDVLPVRVSLQPRQVPAPEGQAGVRGLPAAVLQQGRPQAPQEEPARH